MALAPLQAIFEKKKRRVIGEIIREAKVKTASAFVAIHKSSKDQLVTYESKGLVVAINGSGTLEREHRQSQEAAILSKGIVERGGIIINGGRSSGIMATSADAAKEQYVGILFPEIEKEANAFGGKAIVNSPQPRIELLGTCAPVIVVFRGGLGTMMTLLRAIVHLRNRRYHPEQLSQLLYVSNYWLGLLTSMMNLGALPKEFLKEMIIFDHAQKIINTLPDAE